MLKIIVKHDLFQAVSVYAETKNSILSWLIWYNRSKAFVIYRGGKSRRKQEIDNFKEKYTSVPKTTFNAPETLKTSTKGALCSGGNTSQYRIRIQLSFEGVYKLSSNAVQDLENLILKSNSPLAMNWKSSLWCFFHRRADTVHAPTEITLAMDPIDHIFLI